MISGFLTLFQDPTEDLHAVTKRYVDSATAGVFDPRPRTIGTWYTQQFANGQADTTTTAAGEGRMSLMFAGGAHSWDRIGLSLQVSGTRTWRLGVYSIDSTTFLPTALLLDAGTVSAVGATGLRSITISLSTTSQWLGLANVLETTGTGNYRGNRMNIDSGSGGFQFFGTASPVPSAGIVFVNNVLVCATGVAGLPSPGSWAPHPNNSQEPDGGVFLRKSA